MKHYDYPDSLKFAQQFAPGLTREALYSVAKGISQNDPIGYAQAHWEQSWFAARRPFYRVWPKIIPMLLKLDLSTVRASQLRLPVDVLFVQLPEGNNLGQNGDSQGILLSNMPTSKGPGLYVGMFDGVWTDRPPMVDTWLFELSDEPLVDVLDRLKVCRNPASNEVRQRAVSLAATLCLIGDNPELVSPVVLAKDQHRLTSLNLQDLVARARKRGRIGWDMGKGIEVAPHYRRPHPALVWTGEGRKTPKIVLRSGSLVHRSKVENVPTGFEHGSFE